MSSGPSVCPVCRKATVDRFMEIRQVPVFCGVLWPTRSEAMDSPKGDLDLGFCRHCGHIFNYAFDPKLMDYTVDYDNSLHFSPHFQLYSEKLARHLVEKYSLKGKRVLEIGCGKGDFLALLCEIGGNKGVGFDKSYSPKDTNHKNDLELEIIQDFYSDRYYSYKAELICSRYVLEHIDPPTEFIQNIRKSIGDRREVIVYFEVPNVMYTLRDLGIWDLIYEHCSYFSSSSLAYLFGVNGFHINSISELYDSQFIGIEAFPDAGKASSVINRDVSEIQDAVAEFSEKYRRKVKCWRQRFDDFATAGKRVVVWGCGAKGVMFLNTCDPLQVEFIVDINPRKNGKYVPGTGQEIVSPDFLSSYKPDIVILVNDVYREEISGQLKELRLSPELIVA